jgi:hypothetical protein
MFVCCIFWTYVGRPFKKPFFYNIALTVLLGIDIIVSIAIFFLTPNAWLGTLGINRFHAGVLLGITLATLAVHAVYTVVLKLLKWIK